MYYAGWGNDGHAFVCDGYDNNDNFHFNWGWSGSYNGFYAIGDLNPYGATNYSQQNKAIINLRPLIFSNIGVNKLVSPVTTSFFLPSKITVKITNYDTVPHTNIPIFYSVDNGNPVSEIISFTIPASSDTLYEFTQNFDFSQNPNHIYNVKVYSDFPNDIYKNNDTISVDIKNIACLSPSFSVGFETAEDFEGWEIVNNNNDNSKWTIIDYNGRNEPYCIRYDYNSILSADDWFISSCIELSSSETYKLKFFYKAEDNQWPEKLKVFIGNSKDVSSLTTQLVNLPNINNINYQYAEKTFTIPSDSIYYIGFYCYSNADMFNLYVDDISIDISTSEKNNLLNEGFNIFPNPFTDIVIVENSYISNENIKYEIFSTNDKLITQVISNNNKINISTGELCKGIYILKITSLKGVVIKKIVKQ